jgi:hypothetical protein
MSKKTQQQLEAWNRYKTIKRRREDPRVCVSCKELFIEGSLFRKGRRKWSECHHLTYEREHHERLEDTVFICKECHELLHLFYNRHSRNLNIAHISLWLGLYACPKFFRRIKMTGKITRNLTQEDKDLLGDAWFMAELNAKSAGVDVHDWVNAAIHCFSSTIYNIERHGIGPKLGMVKTTADIIPLFERLHITVKGVDHAIDENIINQMNNYLKNNGCVRTNLEIVSFVKSRAGWNRVTNAESFDAAISWILGGIMKGSDRGEEYNWRS